MNEFCKNISSVLFTALLLLSNSSECAESKVSDDKTEIIIIGTVHESTYNFNSDTLLNIFNKLKPDVILVECDTSYMTPGFKLKDDIEYMFPETIAISEYSKLNPVKLRPYDINGRDIYLDNYKRRTDEANFFSEIEILNENGNLGRSAESILSGIKSMMSLADEMSNSSAAYINSAEGSSNIDTINHYTYTGLKMLIEESAGLSKYKSYWDEELKYRNKRNETMLKNILRYKKQFEGKRIVVLCGFAHKNYLKRNLSNISNKENLEVKEFFEL